MNMFFTRPTQVKFWDECNQQWMGGIGYRDEIICGCCGGIFEVDELLESNSNSIVRLPWVDINEEIRGEE